MRLLHLADSGSLELRMFDHDRLPKYAILSHTWGDSDEEVKYNEFLYDSPIRFVSDRDLCGKGSQSKRKEGYKKIEFATRAAAKDGLSYVWIDTCCINKENSAELSEAVNSMFRWYQEATKCYVYLSDVHLEPNIVPKGDDWRHCFKQSRWFTRGWTLQELIAPREVEFFANQGEKLGTRSQLASLISQITGTDTRLLKYPDEVSVADFSIKKRMSWAVKRRTTRVEDKAYSLLGIFGVKMSIRYGEGTAAFQRFQTAVLGENVEKSGFGWLSPSNQGHLEVSCSGEQRAEKSLGSGFWVSEKPENSEIGSDSDFERYGETLGSDENWSMQNAVSWWAKLSLRGLKVFPEHPILAAERLDLVLPRESIGDARQRLGRSTVSGFEGAVHHYGGVKSCERTGDHSGRSSENEEHGLEAGKLLHQGIRLSAFNYESFIKSRSHQEQCTARQGNLSTSFWQTLFPGPLPDLERHKNEVANSGAPEMEHGSVDDSGFDTESTDWDSSSVTSSDFSENEDQAVLNGFVDITVEQIAQRVYIPASMLTLPENPHSLGHQGDLNLGDRKVETDRGYKRKSEHVDGEFVRTDNRNSHRVKFAQ